MGRIKVVPCPYGPLMAEEERAASMEGLSILAIAITVRERSAEMQHMHCNRSLDTSKRAEGWLLNEKKRREGAPATKSMKQVDGRRSLKQGASGRGRLTILEAQPLRHVLRVSSLASTLSCIHP
eukprot:232434-Pelagomonas_calceolata.AAC.7